jgi:hypothetical protein
MGFSRQVKHSGARLTCAARRVLRPIAQLTERARIFGATRQNASWTKNSLFARILQATRTIIDHRGRHLRQHGTRFQLDVEKESGCQKKFRQEA